MKDKEVLRSSHHGFMNVSNLIAFYSDTSLAGLRKVMEVIYLDFSKAFDAVSCNTFIEKWIQYNVGM